MKKYYNYRCKFCETGFVNEDRYMKHRCKQMERDEEIRSPTGTTAWSYYKLWMTLQKRAAPTVETFLSSKFYNSFIRFAEFAQKVGIPNTEQYIKYMLRQEVSPHIWTNDKMYEDYLAYLDRGKDPTTQAKYTVDYLHQLSEALDCDIGEIFDKLQPSDVIAMLRQRRLSSWILLASPKFKEFVTKRVSNEEKLIITSIIKPTAWVEKRKKNPEAANLMKEIVRELNL